MLKQKSLAKNAVFKIILNICNIIVPVIVGPYILRVLDRSYYDMFNKITADFQFFLIFGALGVYSYGVREISKKRNNPLECSKFFTETMLIGVCSNLLVMAAYIGFSFFMAKSTMELMLYLIMNLQFGSNIFNFEWINEANENYGFIAVKSLIVRLLYFVLIFVLVRQSNDIVWYVTLVIGSAVLNSLVSFLYIKRRQKFTFKGLKFKKHFKPLLLIFIITNLAILYSQLDKIMLGNLINDAAVTRYQVPQFISGMLTSLMLPIVAVSIPRLTNILHTQGKDKFVALYKKVTSTFCMLVIPGSVGIFMLSKEIIMMYGSSQYADCVIPLAVFAVSQLLSCPTYLFGDALLYIHGKEKVLVIFNLVGGVINLAGNFILYFCGMFDSVTAIYTLIAANVTVVILCYIYARKKLGLKLQFFNIKLALYALAALTFVPTILAVQLLHLNIIFTALLSVAICAIIYLIILLLAKDQNILQFTKKITGIFTKKKKESSEEKK